MARKKVVVRHVRSLGRCRKTQVANLTATEKRRRLMRELAKVNRREEQRIAEEGLVALTWVWY